MARRRYQGTLHAGRQRIDQAPPEESVTDPTPKQPRIVEKPWGRETIYAETGRYVGKILFIAQGHRLSLQYHQRKSETMYLLRGHVRLTLGSSTNDLREIDLRVGETIDLPTGTVHRVYAVDDSEILETSTPELDDRVRISDDYGRADSGGP